MRQQTGASKPWRVLGSALAAGLLAVTVIHCGPGVLGGGTGNESTRAAASGTAVAVDDGGGEGGCNRPPENTSGSVTICATSRGSAKAGPYERNGRTLMTSPAAVRNADQYAKQYDGDVVFVDRDLSVSLHTL